MEFFDLDIGTMHTAPLMIAPSFVPELPAEDFIAAIRPAIRHAAVLGCPGRLTDPAEAERLISEDKMQMVGAARAFIAEPEFANNARTGQAERNRICIACNHCLEGILAGVNCVINPATGREEKWGSGHMAEAATRRRIAIIGGGPAGMEAARVAASRGHAVTLFEKEGELGGGLRLSALLPGRESYAHAVAWYQRTLAALEVDIRLRTTVTSDDPELREADAVILASGAAFDATGATGFVNAPIDGYDLPHVYTPERFLAERPVVKGKALILDEDGQSVAVGIAEIIAETGAAVEVVTRWQLVAPKLQINGQFAHVLARLYAAGVTLTPDTYIKSISVNAVTLFNVFTNQERVVSDVSCVVIAGSRRSRLDGWSELTQSELLIIGDALAPRSLFEAAFEGRRAVEDIEEIIRSTTLA